MQRATVPTPGSESAEQQWTQVAAPEPTPCALSIVLSTYNRADMLRIALAWLDDVSIPLGACIEVVVVDNNSSDETRAVVEHFQSRSGLVVKYVFEPRQGLSHARNAGIASCRGNIIAFTDDDCFASGDWIKEILSAFGEHPDLAGCGGRVELYDERDLPLTIRTSRDRGSASLNNLFSLVPGCNMCFRRSVIEWVGPFDVRFGAGTGLCSAEDSDYIYRVISAGLVVEYIPEICVFHAHGRRSDAAAGKLARGYVIGRGAFYAKYILRGDTAVLRQAYWEFRKLFLSVFSGSARDSLRLIRWLFTGGMLYLLQLAQGGVRRDK